MRILHLTDSHFHGRDELILAFLRKMSAGGEFDLVLFTGDLIETAAGLESTRAAASLFRPRVGSFAVLGGHDYLRVSAFKAYEHLLSRHAQDAFAGDNPAQELEHTLQERGVRVLRDSNVRLSAPNGCEFALVGLGDAFLFQPDFGAAWDGLPADIPTIVIAHSPDVLHETCARAARLALFGHTHGGQVRLPILGALITKSELPGRLASGTFRHGETVFVLNNGLGTSPALPYRLLCPPEVTVLELTRAASPEALTPIKEAQLE